MTKYLDCTHYQIFFYFMKVYSSQFWFVFSVVTILCKTIHIHYVFIFFQFIIEIISGRSSPHQETRLIKSDHPPHVKSGEKWTPQTDAKNIFLFVCFAINIVSEETPVLPLADRRQMCTHASVTYPEMPSRRRHCSSLTLPGNAEAVRFELPVELFYERRLCLFVRKVTTCLNIFVLSAANIADVIHVRVFCIVGCAFWHYGETLLVHARVLINKETCLLSQSITLTSWYMLTSKSERLPAAFCAVITKYLSMVLWAIIPPVPSVV